MNKWICYTYGKSRKKKEQVATVRANTRADAKVIYFVQHPSEGKRVSARKVK